VTGGGAGRWVAATPTTCGLRAMSAMTSTCTPPTVVLTVCEGCPGVDSGDRRVSGGTGAMVKSFRESVGTI
jgi:hypothetical protein